MQLTCELFIVFPYLGNIICGSALLLAFDNFISVYRPYTHKQILTPRRATLSILFSFVVPLVLILLAALTGQRPPADRSLCSLHDSYFTPVQILLILSIILALLILSVALQTATIILVSRMNHVGVMPFRIMIKPVMDVAMHERDQPSPYLSATSFATYPEESATGLHQSPKLEPIPGTSSSQTTPYTVTTVHVLMSSERDVRTQNKVQRSLRGMPQPLATPANRQTRMIRLMQLVTLAVLLTLVCWLPYFVINFTTAVCDIFEIERLGLGKINIAVLLPVVEGIVYPIIIIALSSELRASLKSLLCRSCSNRNS